MNREILFRGRCIDEEWVYGDYLSQFNGNCSFIGIFGGGIKCVIPETVGRYTGLCDKNGTKIFEGDIVKEFYPNCSIEEYRYDIGRVFYYKNMARFLRTSKRFPDCYADMSIDKTNNKCKVVGNIYDNPELLKGEENES